MAKTSEKITTTPLQPLTDADYVKLASHARSNTKKVRKEGDTSHKDGGGRGRSLAAKPQYDPLKQSYERKVARGKGVRHILSQRFLLDMCDDWKEHGTDVLAAVRTNDPATYLRVMASLVPKTLTLEDSSDGKSVGELRSELLVELGRALERGDAQLTGHLESIQQGKRPGSVIEVQAVSEAEIISPERSDAS